MWKRDPGITAALAQRIVEVRYEDMPPKAVEAAKIIMLDALGCMAAVAAVEPIGKVIADFLREEAARPECTCVGMGLKTSPYWAAFANGSTCRAIEWDPFVAHHGCGATLPACLAMTEKLGLSGRRLLEAFIIAVEMQHRVNEAGLFIPDSKIVSAYGRGIIGLLAAAASASKLLGLDTWKTQQTLGIACSRAGGIDSSGTMCNPADSGHAASSGVFAAIMASRGFTGRENAIEEPFGFKQYLGEGAPLESIVEEFGRPWLLAETEIRLKRYPSQGGTQPIIACIEALYQEKPWQPQEIEAVEVVTKLMPRMTPYNYYTVRNDNPRSGIDGHFSLLYSAAVAVLDGTVGIDSFSDEKRNSPAAIDMMKKMKITLLEAAPAGLKADGGAKKLGASHMDDLQNMWMTSQKDEASRRDKVIIRFRDGSVRSREVAGAEPLSSEEALAKFMDISTRALPRASAEALVDIVGHLEKQDDLTKMFAAL